jgi:hypothetical protein
MPVYTTNLDRDRVVLDVAKKIAEYEPDETPFTVILMRAKKRKTINHEYIWFEDSLGARWTQINNATGYTYDATSIVVDDGSVFAPGDMLKVPRTGETMRVTAVSTNTLTVIRDWGQTRPAATPTAYDLQDNDWVLNIGNAMKEGSTAPQPKIGQPTKVSNFVQIFRTPFDVTGTVNAEEQVTSEQERARLSRKKGKEHRIDIERAMLFGEKREYINGNEIIRTTGGATQFIKTNVYDAGGVLTETNFEREFLVNVFNYGSSRKLLVASPLLLSVINGFGRDKIRLVPKDEAYGLRISQYISTFGDLYMVPSKVLVNYYNGWGFVFDMDYVSYRPLRDTVLKRNIQQNDEDVIRDEYFTEAGFELKLEKAHGIIKGVTG